MSASVRWIDSLEEALAMAPEDAAGWVVRLDDPRVDGWLARSPPSSADLAAFAGGPDAGERMVRRRLARLLLGVVAGRAPGDVALGRTPDGGVCVERPAGRHLSLAGRLPWCAIAVGQAPLGIDIEPVAGEPLPADLLTVAERAWLAGLPPAARLRASLACWVAKEAHAKRLGRPRSLDPAAVETRPAGEPGLVRSGADRSRLAMAGGEEWVAAMAFEAADDTEAR